MDGATGVCGVSGGVWGLVFRGGPGTTVPGKVVVWTEVRVGTRVRRSRAAGVGTTLLVVLGKDRRCSCGDHRRGGSEEKGRAMSVSSGGWVACDQPPEQGSTFGPTH